MIRGVCVCDIILNTNTHTSPTALQKKEVTLMTLRHTMLVLAGSIYICHVTHVNYIHMWNSPYRRRYNCIERGVIQMTHLHIFKWLWRSPAAPRDWTFSAAFPHPVRSVDKTHCFCWCLHGFLWLCCFVDLAVSRLEKFNLKYPGKE